MCLGEDVLIVWSQMAEDNGFQFLDAYAHMDKEVRIIPTDPCQNKDNL